MDTALIILNFNDSSTTIELLNKIKNYQSIDLIIVVDNASSDNSWELLKKFENDKIKVIQTSKNGGYGYGNNYGFRYAFDLGIKYVGIANPDVDFTEDCFKKMVYSISSDPKCGAVAPVSFDRNGKLSSTIAWKQPSALIETLTASVILARVFWGKTHYKNNYLFSSTEVEVDILPGSFLMLNADHFSAIGMYDESVFLYCEEKIVAKKFAEKSINTKLLTNIRYTHKHSESINKSIPSQLNKTRIWLESKEYFILEYILGNKKMKYLVRLYLRYARVESLLITNLKEICKMK